MNSEQTLQMSIIVPDKMKCLKNFVWQLIIILNAICYTLGQIKPVKFTKTEYSG